MFRFVQFRTPVKIPGKDEAQYVFQHDAEHQNMGGYDLSYDERMRAVRISVPASRRKQGVGIWYDRSTKQPMYGLGAVIRVPMENVLKYELVEDVDENANGTIVRGAMPTKPAGIEGAERTQVKK